MIRSYALMMLTLLLTSAASAQDIQLSVEPTTTRLSPDNRTVSAAQIGSLILLVWGTHIEGSSPNSVQNVLRTQLLRDDSLVGSYQTPHSTAAYPSTYRKVFALQDRFMLLWNDLRSGTYQLYLRIIDTTGMPLGEEIVIGDGMESDSYTFLLPATNGWMLIWSSKNDSGASYRQLLSPTGNLLSIAERLPTSFITDITSYSQPKITLFYSQKDSSIIMNEHEEVDHRLLPTNRFAKVNYLWPDSSLSILQDSLILRYTNLFDLFPSDTTIINFPDNWLKGTEIISRDSVGELRILGWQKTYYSSVYMLSALYPERQLQQIQRYDTIKIYQSGSTRISNIRYYQTTFQKLCDNNYTINTLFKYDVWDSFDEKGWVGIWSINYITSSNGKIYSTKGLDSLPCGLPPPTIASRERLEAVNWIKVVINNNDRYFYLDSLIPYKPNATQHLPAIVLRNNRLMVGYKQVSPPDIPVAEPYYLSEWCKPQGNFCDFQIAKVPSGVYGYCDFHEWVTRPNYFILSCMSDIVVKYRGRVELIATGAARYIPTDTDWYAARAWNSLGYHNHRTLLTSGYNPNQQELTMVDNYGGATSGRSYATLNANGDSIAGGVFTDNKLYGEVSSDIIPINKNSFLLFGIDQTFLYQSGSITVIPDYTLPSGATVQRLIDDSFLEVYSKDSLDIRLRVFSFDGKLRHDKVFSFKEKSPFFVGQSINHGDIYILRGGKTGVKLTLLNRNLKVLTNTDTTFGIVDIPISDTRDSVGIVSGVFRNDSLFVVWEDFRHGLPDIYGTAWKRSNDIVDPDFIPPPDTASQADSPFAILNMGPTPVSGFLSLQVRVQQPGMLTLHVVDAIGKVVKQQHWEIKGKVENIFLNTEGLFPGAYTAVLEISGHRQTQRFIVIR